MSSRKTAWVLAASHALVTGGAGNIGREICLKMAACGTNVTVVYHQSIDRAETLVDEIASSGGSAQAVCADVQDEQSVRNAFAQAEQRFGPVGILVNNAGGFTLADQENLTADDWHHTADLNLTGAFFCCRQAIPSMKRQGGGVIVNMASINGLHPGFGQTAHYDAAKAGLIGYTKSLAAEVGPYGIRVNAVSPGLISTEGLLKKAPELARQVRGRSPLRRLAEPGDAADAVLYLASDASLAVTGTVMVVDCGYLLS